MRRMLAGAARLAVLCGSAGTALLWAFGVVAAYFAVWQYAGLALLLATGLGLSTYGVHRLRRA